LINSQQSTVHSQGRQRLPTTGYDSRDARTETLRRRCQGARSLRSRRR
jgi:hypothetical protein